MEVSNENAPDCKGFTRNCHTSAEIFDRLAAAEEQRKLKTRENLAFTTICLFIQIFKFK